MASLIQRRSDGTIQSRRVQQHWPSDKPFKILSIDGGGICGLLPASILAEFEHRFLNGESVANHFDMIAGTSTGGIIALGLGYGYTAKQIRDFYIEHGAKIFPPTSRIGRLYRILRQGLRYSYEREPLEAELVGLFGNAKLGDSKKRLCIPAFEGIYGEPWIFKTPHHPDYKRDRMERMVTIGLSTSAAPTFFRALPNGEYLMVDGGLWANNPIMNALVDTLACYDVDRPNVRILSLGCGETSFTVDSAKAKGGFFHWRYAIKAAMRAQSLNALGQAFLLIGKDNVIRIDAPQSANAISLDDYVRAKNELPSMARALAEASGHHVQEKFFQEAVEHFKAIPVAP